MKKEELRKELLARLGRQRVGYGGKGRAEDDTSTECIMTVQRTIKLAASLIGPDDCITPGMIHGYSNRA